MHNPNKIHPVAQPEVVSEPADHNNRKKRLDKVKKFVAVATLGVGLGVAGSEASSHISQETTWAAPEPVEYSQRDLPDLIAVEQAPIADFVKECTWSEHDVEGEFDGGVTSFENEINAIKGAVTIEDKTALLADSLAEYNLVTSNYDIDSELSTAAQESLEYFGEFGEIEDIEQNHENYDALSEATINVLSMFPREVVDRATKEFLIVSTISGYRLGLIGQLAGAAEEDILILSIELGRREAFRYESKVQYFSEVVIHEFTHALDKNLCPQGAENSKSYISHNPSDFKYAVDGGVIEDIDFKPSKVRKVRRWYAGKSVWEDRAEMIADLFFTRGIIQEGDIDEGSPYALKQAEMVNELAGLFPDFDIVSYLNGRTELIRGSGFFNENTMTLQYVVG